MQFGFSFEGKIFFSPPAIPCKVFKVRSFFCLRKCTFDENQMDKGGNEAQSGKCSFCNLIFISLASDGGMQLVTV